MSKAITEQRDERTERLGEGRPREIAPSLVREDEPQVGRTIGIISLAAVLIGADLMCWLVYKVSLLRALYWWVMSLRKLPVGPGGPALTSLGAALGTLAFFGGLGGLLLHATVERDLQLRRAYGLLGCLWLVLGAVLVLCSIFGVSWAANYFVTGVGCGLLALLFLLAFLRHETEAEWHDLALNGIGVVGAVLAVGAFLGSNLRLAFIMPEGVLLALLGLAYLWAYVAVRGGYEELSRRVALGVGALGAVVALVAVVRGALQSGTMVPTGVLLIGLGLLYALVYVLYYVELPLVVMSRRELTAFFYSPVGYIVLFVFTAAGWVTLLLFLWQAMPEPGQEPELFEPVVRHFLFGFFPVIAILIVVPALTMRSYSEEKRSGTLELLLTIPVGEWSVVLSKFLGALAFFLLMWVPWFIFMFTVYVMGGKEHFQLLPVLSFLIVMVALGANFLSMGLFFSSITRNQIISFMLAFAGMLCFIFLYFAEGFVQRNLTTASPWLMPVLTHLSFVELWYNSLDGQLQWQHLLFHVSAAFFWLFATVKVLEARKWS
jgi:ABC-2 type transport system permease protein